MKTNELKCTDLRIGNWVKVNDPIFGVNAYKVATIRDNGIITLSDNISCSVNNIEPIELTEEVLLKIGFKNMFQSVITKGRFELNANIGDNEFINIVYHIYKSGESNLNITQRRCESVCDNSIHKHNIKYLHELQNAYYCLTGQELNIEL
jgi:hypothetical protein